MAREAAPPGSLGDVMAQAHPPTELLALQRIVAGQPTPSGGADPLAGDSVHEAARLGISGAAGTLPHFDQIQKSFGHHDLSGVAAHTDARAAQGSHAMGATAFTTSNHVAFAAAPSLHTAAHEAAHVVQQRAGIQLEDGLGKEDDEYERHADQVAERVVRGESSEALLDQHAGRPSSAPAATPIQMEKTGAPEAPQPAPAAKPATNEAGKEAAPAADVPEPAEMSALRKELIKLFVTFEKKIVGDPEFDSIIKEKSWNNAKDEEEFAKWMHDIDMDEYNKKLAEWNKTKSGPKPLKPNPVPVYTTCIDTQRILLQKAFAAVGGAKIKKVAAANKFGKIVNDKQTTTYSFATLGPKQAASIGAWTEATANMPKDKRPKRGDIIVLAKRGEKTDKAAGALSFAESQVEKGQKDLDKAEDKVQAAEDRAKEAQQALDEAQQKLTNPEPKTKLEMLAAQAAAENAKRKMSAALAQIKLAQANADKKQEQLGKAEAAVPQAEETLNKLRAATDHAFFTFSHVGFVQSITVNKNKDGEPDGTETWVTFDGGQRVQSRGGAQGSETVRRIYRPAVNEIAGEESQGGAARWLQGWVDVDKLVAEPTPPASGAKPT